MMNSNTAVGNGLVASLDMGISELETWSNGKTRNLRSNFILQRRNLESLTRKDGGKVVHEVGIQTVLPGF